MNMLTTEQLTTLKAAILADPTLAAFYSAGNGNPIAAHFNQLADPAVVIWKTVVTRDNVMGSGFDFTQVDNLTVGQARIFDWLFDNAARSMNPAENGTRAAIVEAWKGTGAKVAVQTYILGLCKRPATRYEAMFATGLGTTASPSAPALDADGKYIVGNMSPAQALEA